MPTVCKEKMSSKNKQTQNWRTTNFVDMNHNNRIMNEFKILRIKSFLRRLLDFNQISSDSIFHHQDPLKRTCRF